MKLARFDTGNGPRVGIMMDDGVIDVSARTGREWTMRQIMEGAPGTLSELAELAGAGVPTHHREDIRLLAPIERPGKYLAIGMNYAKHIEESDKLGVPRAKYQTWFNKQTTCITGPFDDIVVGVTEKLDYEVELVAVIGKPAKRVTEAQAPGHIFGYVVGNDVSARDWQFHTPTFTMGKSFDTHGPVGPWLVTADEIPDPHALGLRCYVNGDLRQSSNTRNMLNNLWAQIAYLSQAFTLETGDLIATGTPEGVGIGREPPVFLQIGDVVRCEIDGIGTIENTVVA